MSTEVLICEAGSDRKANRNGECLCLFGNNKSVHVYHAIPDYASFTDENYILKGSIM